MASSETFHKEATTLGDVEGKTQDGALGHDEEAVPLGTRMIGQQHRVFVERGLNFFAVQRVHPVRRNPRKRTK